MTIYRSRQQAETAAIWHTAATGHTHHVWPHGRRWTIGTQQPPARPSLAWDAIVLGVAALMWAGLLASVAFVAVALLVAVP
jgi:hypothetical protein